MFIRTLRALPARWLARQARRRSMAFLLRRIDDHLIDDIGRTRDEVQCLLDHYDPQDAPPFGRGGALRGPRPMLSPSVR